ncbi:hypothetical protein AAH994_00915 [Weeksellaceae bacterium A-14]
MNPIDIEKLNRSNIYNVPPGCFAEIQENVVTAVSQEKREKKSVFPLSLKWKYSIAAAVVLLFGLSVFFLSDQPEESSLSSLKTITANSQRDTDSGNRKVKTNEERFVFVLPQHTAENTSEPEANTHSVAGSRAKVSVVETSPVHHVDHRVEKKADHSLNENIETLISSYSPSELEEVAGKAAPDVYLDLFD